MAPPSTGIIAAIVHGHAGPGRLSTEADWSDPGKLAPYPQSKMQAERVA